MKGWAATNSTGPDRRKQEASMMRNIDRDEVQRMAGTAKLVDVLPAKAYEAEHLPGAISVPLKSLTREAVSRLHHGRPVIVYCYDNQ